MLAVAQSVVHHGSLSVPPELGVVGADGDYYSKYGLLLPLLSVIPIALVQPVGVVTGHVAELEAAAASLLMPLVAGALVAALFLLGRRLGAPRPAAALVAAGAVLGTFILPYGRDFFTEPLVALGLVVMIERSLAGRELQAGAALAFAILARPQAAVFAPLLWAFLLLRGDGIRVVARTLPPLAIAAIVTVAYNLVRFEEPFEFGYKKPDDPGFTTPFFEGAAGLLFSPEKSIFLFAPIVVLLPFALAWLWRRERVTAGLLLAIFTVTFVLAATWHSWEGGWSWGPRLLLPGRRDPARIAGAVDRARCASGCGSRLRSSGSGSRCRSRRCSLRSGRSSSTRPKAPTVRRSSVRCGRCRDLTRNSVDAVDDRGGARRRLPALPRGVAGDRRARAGLGRGGPRRVRHGRTGHGTRARRSAARARRHLSARS